MVIGRPAARRYTLATSALALLVIALLLASLGIGPVRLPPLTVLDALMNSFIFFPAVMIAGALAAAHRPRGEITRVPRRHATA
jgi:hypothetical protein